MLLAPLLLLLVHDVHDMSTVANVPYVATLLLLAFLLLLLACKNPGTSECLLLLATIVGVPSVA
jgi:hypothetical protein